ncbi:MAG: response regulator transcription factor [Bacteroidetes bacterium]|nr:response regulator transcription factor [Bacteroidota bacterium]
MKKIRLLLIEDNRLLRDGIIAMLKKQSDIKIIAASGNNENTITKIRQLKPNIILLDSGLRSRNSLTLVEVVKKDFPNAKVIVMDLAPVQGDINLFVKAGASGFILKDATLDDFLVTIRTVAEGSNVLPPNLNESLFTKIVEHALKGGKLKLKEAVRMTKREREVIGLIGDGLSNKEIGQMLRVSTFTVKSHIHNIMEKLALHTRLEVANYSYSTGTLKKIANNITTAK